MYIYLGTAIFFALPVRFCSVVVEPQCHFTFGGIHSGYKKKHVLRSTTIYDMRETIRVEEKYNKNPC